jgi:uncharacterized cupredoxin-like copper-binding protein
VKQKQLFITLFILAMAMVLGACSGASAATRAPNGAAIPEISIEAADYSFEAPAQIEAGLVKLNLVNNGQEPHHAQLARLNEGTTMDQFLGALQQGPEAAFPLITFVGGPGLLDAGFSQQVTLDLIPGQYVLLCFMESHDGMPHLAKGMIKPLEVVATSEEAEVSSPQPKADATIKLMDFSFVLPAEIKAGEQVWEVVNEGPQIHEIMIVKLAEDKGVADVQSFLQSPHGAPPFTNLGGFQALTPGETGWLNLNLEPGEYAALCHVPDPASGHAHTQLGMVMPFTVK